MVMHHMMNDKDFFMMLLSKTKEAAAEISEFKTVQIYIH